MLLPEEVLSDLLRDSTVLASGLSAYALNRLCPVLTYRMVSVPRNVPSSSGSTPPTVLRLCYAVSGTSIACAAVVLCDVQYWPRQLCYAATRSDYAPL
eukprot:3941743-Rhodomonas_salina.3